MRRVWIAALISASAAVGATRPQYGGTLRVETRLNAETPDPPALLGSGFQSARWEAGRLAVYEADENASGGRPYLNVHTEKRSIGEIRLRRRSSGSPCESSLTAACDLTGRHATSIALEMSMLLVLNRRHGL